MRQHPSPSPGFSPNLDFPFPPGKQRPTTSCDGGAAYAGTASNPLGRHLLMWWHRQEPFLAGQLFHNVQRLWGNDPTTVLIELWKLSFRSAQPTQYASPSFCCLHPHRDKNILAVVRGNQHQTARRAAYPIARN